MTKVVINVCYGGFSLSKAAISRLKELGVADADEHSFSYSPDENTQPRTDPKLIQVVEELGHKANGTYAVLKIVEIPDDVHFEIEGYDGIEWVAEKHRTWR